MYSAEKNLFINRKNKELVNVWFEMEESKMKWWTVFGLTSDKAGLKGLVMKKFSIRWEALPSKLKHFPGVQKEKVFRVPIRYR